MDIVGKILIILLAVIMLTLINLMTSSSVAGMLFADKKIFDHKHIFWSWICSCVLWSICVVAIIY